VAAFSLSVAAAVLFLRRQAQSEARQRRDEEEHQAFVEEGELKRSMPICRGVASRL
jgi:hypothetical protein